MGVQINGDTGNISATKADYSGNVTIGGTLTYEDVTNIDSVGLITAREGIEIGARPGVAASISVDGNAIFSGITTATTIKSTTGIVTTLTSTTLNVDGGDATFTGASANIIFDKSDDALEFNDDAKATFGTGADTTLTHSGADFAITNTTGNLNILNNSAEAVQIRHGSETMIKAVSDGAVELYHDDSKKLETASGGVTVTGTVTATSFAGSGAALTGISAGITEFDMWYLHTNHSADASSEILGVSGSSTIQRHTSMSNSVAQAAQIGTGMSFDSSTGIFTFPSTGKYLVINNSTISIHGNDNAGVMTRISTDGGSNFTTASLAYIGDSDGGMHSGVSFNFVDVTNTSNIKVRFRQDSLGTNSYVVGSSGYARTVFIFARIGDT